MENSDELEYGIHIRCLGFIFICAICIWNVDWYFQEWSTVLEELNEGGIRCSVLQYAIMYHVLVLLVIVVRKYQAKSMTSAGAVRLIKSSMVFTAYAGLNMVLTLWRIPANILEDHVRSSFSKVNSDDSHRIFFERMQTLLQCCGVESYVDWYRLIGYVKCYLFPIFPGSPLPNSCYKLIHNRKYLHKTGCATALVEDLQNNATLIAVITILLIVIQISGFLFEYSHPEIPPPDIADMLPEPEGYIEEQEEEKPDFPQ